MVTIKRSVKVTKALHGGHNILQQW